VNELQFFVEFTLPFLSYARFTDAYNAYRMTGKYTGIAVGTGKLTLRRL